MNRVWIVASYEFMSNLRKPSFLFALFGLPLVMGGVFAIVAFVSASAFYTGDVREDAIGFVDAAGIVPETAHTPQGWQRYASEEAARAAFDAGTIDGYFLVDQAFMRTGRLAFYTRGTASSDLHDRVEAFVIAGLVADAGGALPTERLKTPVQLNIFLLNTNRLLTPSALVALIVTPLVFMIVFMMGTQFSSSFLMSGVTEEKSNRVIELLLTTVTPEQLLGGKMLGLGALALLQFFAWTGLAIALYLLTQSANLLIGFDLPWDVIGLALVYFVLTYFFYSSLLAGVGAIVDGEEESRQYAGLITLPTVAPLLFANNFLADPSGTVPVILSHIPFTAGMAVIVRAAFGVVALPEILLSLAILLASTLFVIWAAARLFRWGLLLYGKKITLRDVLRVIGSSRVKGPV